MKNTFKNYNLDITMVLKNFTIVEQTGNEFKFEKECVWVKKLYYTLLYIYFLNKQLSVFKF